MPISEEDIPLTAFTCHKGLFEFSRMLFGLTNTPATLQRSIDVILAGYIRQKSLVYLDYTIVYSKDEEERFKHLDEVLTASRKSGVSLNFRKCTFFMDKIKYLRHIIRPGTLEVEQ